MILEKYCVCDHLNTTTMSIISNQPCFFTNTWFLEMFASFKNEAACWISVKISGGHWVLMPRTTLLNTFKINLRIMETNLGRLCSACFIAVFGSLSLFWRRQILIPTFFQEKNLIFLSGICRHYSLRSRRLFNYYRDRWPWTRNLGLWIDYCCSKFTQALLWNAKGSS